MQKKRKNSIFFALQTFIINKHLKEQQLCKEIKENNRLNGKDERRRIRMIL
jgi:hypothetical protein